jgi:hypothetical protein
MPGGQRVQKSVPKKVGRMNVVRIAGNALAALIILVSSVASSVT